ncbi:hypothetical protein B0T10DRAFT_205586 [Thelonectria olida]|uniref:Zn(2)-C6 fungal-type domain-containing protein n=1 Tax=Thelonectria olida TaxID=1576542 RepID=A0A9P9AJL7_9HYPO|nr:hypothetical protein B0T10DRAFT_205586 [Thelonectria olida]
MPPLRSGRASKACDLCRKNKTRCYATNGVSDSCLRCETLSQPCSLTTIPNSEPLSYTPAHQNRLDEAPRPPSKGRSSSVDTRFVPTFCQSNRAKLMSNRVDSRSLRRPFRLWLID